jgi:hypothetical protein
LEVEVFSADQRAGDRIAFVEPRATSRISVNVSSSKPKGRDAYTSCINLMVGASRHLFSRGSRRDPDLRIATSSGSGTDYDDAAYSAASRT